MKKRLTRIAPLKLGLVTGLCFAAFGVLSLTLELLVGGPMASSHDSDFSYNQVPLSASPASLGSSPTGNPGVHAIQLSNGVVPDSPTVTKSSTTTTPSGGPNDPLTFNYHPTGTAIVFSLPFLYTLGFPTVMGFFFGWIGALTFNLFAKWTGGIEVTVEDIA